MHSPSQSKAWLWPAVLVAFVLAACSRTEPTPEAMRSVRTMTVTMDGAQSTQEFAAEVRARTESRLAFRVGGELRQRQVDIGSVVRAGQLLAELDPQDLRLGATAAQAAVESAQVGAAQARADFARFKALHDQGFISAAELNRRESTLRQAESLLAQVQAQGELQGNQASYSQLLAPATGVITAVEAEPGAVLAVGQPVVRLAHDGARDVVFSVPEDGVAGVRALIGRDGAVQTRLWGTAQSMPATVREVAAAADPTTRTFLVKASLGAAGGDLGRTATVALVLPPRIGVAQLPLSALFERQGSSMVWVLDAASMTVRAQVVQVAGAHGNQALVGVGLESGIEIVTAGVHVLTEGQRVRRYVVPSAAAAAASR